MIAADPMQVYYHVFWGLKRHFAIYVLQSCSIYGNKAVAIDVVNHRHVTPTTLYWSYVFCLLGAS